MSMGLKMPVRRRSEKKKEEEREQRRAVKKEKRKGECFVEERDLDKQHEMDEHYLKMVRDMYHLRDYYYNEYSRLLSDKVEKQRKDIRDRNEKLGLEKQKKEDEERKSNHVVKKRLERHTLQTTPNTATVPKTDLYYIIGLEEKLRREGRLKTPSDYQKFHTEIQQPHVFYSQFKVRKNTDTAPMYDGSFDGLSSSYSYSRGESNDLILDLEPRPPKYNNNNNNIAQGQNQTTTTTNEAQASASPQSSQPHPPSHPRHQQQQQLLPLPQSQQNQEQMRSLSRISESMENSSRPTSRAAAAATVGGAESWAVTQQFPSQYKSRRSIGSISNVPSNKTKADQLSDLEKRFPKLEMPKLHCFTLNLSKKPPDPEEVQLKADLKSREKMRKQAGRTYTKMYQLAMSNAAATSRILDMHDDMDLLLHGPDLCDVISDDHWMRAYGMREINVEGNQIDGNTPVEIDGEHQDETNKTRSHTSSRNGSASGASKPGSRKGSRRSSAKSQKSEEKIEEEAEELIPFALTLDEITENCNIKESKALSSMWNNYLKAGKSPWEMNQDPDDPVMTPEL